ncbi:MAG: FecR domain-containing protein [Patescibacteria group bacterium]|jgi:hypothetical protein
MKGKYTNILIVAVLAIIVGGGIYWYSQYSTIEIYVDSSLSNEEQTTLAATLAYQQGEVMAQVDGAEWAVVETDTVLHEGDAVKTGLNSKAIVELENGDVVRLGYSTEITLTSLRKLSVRIDQVSGASYNRVAKNLDRTYIVRTDDATVQALGTAFNVVKTAEQMDVTVVESNVDVITESENKELGEGKRGSIKNQAIEISDIDPENLTNDWYTWNKEEDSKKDDSLGVLEPFAGPDVTITSPDGVATVANPEATIVGTVSDVSAKLTVNGTEINNDNGAFSHAVNLVAGKNIFTIIAENSSGYKTIKEVKIIYQTETAATPIKLEATTEDDGVHLSWNESTGSAFQYYKVVRSENNANLNYPDDGYIAVKNKGEESYTDTDVSEDGTYYYRVCEVMTADQVFCSNVAHMKGKKTQEQQTEREQEEQQVGIFLTGEAQTAGVLLQWEVKNMNISNGFKVVKGNSANPVYPGNDYKLLTDNNATSYAWDLTDGQTYHFRVCEYNGSGACLVYSNDIAVTAKGGSDNGDETEGSASVMSVTAEESGVGIWWTDTSSNPGFKYYKVVRSETNPNLRYPDDDYIAVKSEDETSYRDFSAVNGTSYYYRICTVGDTTFCSNVIQVTAINNNAVPSAVTLSGSFEENKITLSWTKSNEADFKYYKLVWSKTDSTPQFPADGYIKAISNVASLSVEDEGGKSGSRTADENLMAGTHYYSICVVDQADQVKCSNTVTLIDGEVQ